MESKFQTSFIPKKTITQTNGSVKPPHTTNLFSLVATVIFITMLLLGAGVFAYQYYLTSHNKQLKANLEQELTRFEPALISDLTRLDNRIESTKTILNNHLALTEFFNFLSRSTLRSLRFTNFRYEVRPATQDVLVKMEGTAQSYSAIALQSEEFSKDESASFIKDPIFSNLKLDDKGLVKFEFSSVIGKQALLYKNTVTGSQPAASVSTTTSTTTNQ